MSILPDVELFGGLVIGDGESATLPSEPSGGLSSRDELPDVAFCEMVIKKKELITAFNGRKCIFKAVFMERTDRGFDDPHVFLLCLSVARQTSAEETVQLIFNTSVKRFRGVRYVLVGTQIDKRLSMLIENYGCGQKKYLPMPMDQGESRYVEWNGATNTLALPSD